MGLRLTIVAAAAVGAVVACSSGSSFECQTNQQCAGEGGVCEPTGYCSFPDAACESGQRYGDYAGGLAGQCVVDDSAPTSGVTAASASATGSSSGPTTATSGPGDGTTSEPVATSSPTADDSAGDEATTGQPPECWVEEFEQDLLGETWWFWEDAGVSASMGGGEAGFELADGTGYGGMGTNFLLDVSGKTATWTFNRLPDLEDGERYEVALSTVDSAVLIEFTPTSVLGWLEMEGQTLMLFQEPAPPGDLVVVQVAESAGTLVVSVTNDNGDSAQVATLPSPDGFDPTATNLEFRAGRLPAATGISGELYAESVSVCPSP